MFQSLSEFVNAFSTDCRLTFC